MASKKSTTTAEESLAAGLAAVFAQEEKQERLKLDDLDNKTLQRMVVQEQRRAYPHLQEAADEQECAFAAWNAKQAAAKTEEPKTPAPALRDEFERLLFVWTAFAWNAHRFRSETR